MVVCLIMIGGSLCMTTGTASATVTKADPLDSWYGDQGDYKAIDCNGVFTSSLVSSKINYIQAKYKYDKKYPGSGLCYGYAVKINSMFGNSNKKTTLDKKLTAANIKTYLKGCKPGTHLRLTGGYGTHSIVLFKVTDKMIYWADNNSMPGGANLVHYYAQPISGFYHLGTFKKMSYMEEPKALKYASKPDVASMRLQDGYTHLYWMKTVNTESYSVYRKTGNGLFARIKSGVTAKTFVDKTAVPGKTYTYKIKAIKKDGSTVSGARCTAKAHLGTPVVKVKNNKDGKIVISWKKIKGANKYKIYTYSKTKYDYVLLKTINSGSTTSFIDNTAKDYTTKHQYIVRALGTYDGKTLYSYYSLDSDYITQDNVEPAE